MKKFLVPLLALATTLAITPAAMADSTFSYTFTATDPNTWVLTGTLDVSQIGSQIGTDTYTINSGTMNVYFDGVNQGLGPATLAPVGTDGSDNVISVISPYIDLGGFSFLFANGGSLYINQFYGDSNGPWGIQINNLSNWFEPGQGNDFPGVMDIQTPEPGSLFLLGTGLLGLAIILFRKAKPSHLVLGM